MAQKKAFVRYAANKAVPGSLIVRTKAPKVGTWKEVPYDVCCDGGGGCCDSLGPFVFTGVSVIVVGTGGTISLGLKCYPQNEEIGALLSTDPDPSITDPFSLTPLQIVNFINDRFSSRGINATVVEGGTFEDVIITSTNPNHYTCGCVNEIKIAQLYFYPAV